MVEGLSGASPTPHTDPGTNPVKSLNADVRLIVQTPYGVSVTEGGWKSYI
jgi:hypothetical protein